MSIWMSAALSAMLFMQQAAPAATTTPTPPAAEDETTVEGLTVTARPTPETKAIEAFVGSIAAETNGATKRLGRWDRSICPGVVGMRNDYAKVLIDRIATTAVDVGLKVGEPGCKANMVILATAESDKLAKQMVDDFPDAFAKWDEGIRQPRAELDKFVVSQAPVRWWHVAFRTTADGQRFQQGDSITIRGVSRRNASTREDFDRVIIILDVKRAGKLQFATLADYIAMVGLAQIDPDADIGGANSVLNLFADRAAGAAPVSGMTDWDRAYLKGLYSAQRAAPSGKFQKRDVVRSMSDDLGAAKKDADDRKDK